MGYPAQQAPQPVDRTVQGTLQGVEQRNAGWFRFLVLEPGMQYPVKADTKKPELVQQAMGLIGQFVAVQIREQQSTKINENTGQFFVNRYLNAIAPQAQGATPGIMPPQGAPPPTPLAQIPGVAHGTQYAGQPTTVQEYAQPGAPPPVAQPQQQFTPGVQGQEKDMNIMRQTASKVVAQMLVAGVIRFDPESEHGLVTALVQACEAWLAYYVHGPLRFGVQAFSTPHNVPPQHDTVGSPPPYDGQQPEQATPAGWGGDPGPEQGDPGLDSSGLPANF